MAGGSLRRVAWGRRPDCVQTMSDGGPDAVNRELQRIVTQMQRLQRQIAADQQPPSMHELDSLKRLGQQYGELVERLAALRDEADGPEPG